MKKQILFICCLISILLLGNNNSFAQEAFMAADPGTHICLGSSATLHITFPAVGPSRYTWKVNSTIITSDSVSGTSDSFVVSGLHNGDTVKSAYVVHGVMPDTTYYGEIFLVFTVDSTLPDAGTITGSSSLCVGVATTLTDTAIGGIWSSTAGASVTGGVATGSAPGVDTVFYTVTNGCGTVTASYPVTVDTPVIAGAIFGLPSVCAGSWITLTDAVSGGVWSAANGNATVASAVVTGVAAGIDTIFYTVTNACGTNHSGFVISIDTALPVLPAITVTGTPTLCVGTTVELHDAVAGGVWSSNNIVRATVNDTGLVSLLSGGGDTIFYAMTNGCGTATVWHFIDIHHVPVLSPITPDTAVCLGSTTTLHCTPAGGTWSSTLPVFATITSSGVVNGLLHGATVIAYTYTNACGTASDSLHFNVDITAQPIIGSDIICQAAIGVFFDPVPGGTWSIDNPFAAFPVPGTPGAFFGLLPNTANIIYTLVNACGTSTAEFPVTVEVCPSGVPGVAQAAGSVAVFPNPSTGDITIDITSPANELADIIITNTVGAKVKELTIPANGKTAITLDEPAGVYFVTARTSDAQHTAKIILVK